LPRINRQAVDPIKIQPGIEGEGGNTFMLRLIRAIRRKWLTRTETARVLGPGRCDGKFTAVVTDAFQGGALSKIDQAKRKLIDHLVKEQRGKLAARRPTLL